MSENIEHGLSEYLRMDRLPHIWCEGCGLGIILRAYVEALKETRMDLDKVVTVSGIGCAGRASGYVNTDAFHTTHGRAIKGKLSFSKKGIAEFEAHIGQESFRIKPFTKSNAWGLFPSGKDKFKKGDFIECYTLTGIN